MVGRWNACNESRASLALRRIWRLFRFAIVLGLPVAIWSLWLEPSSLRNENHTIELPHWPESCDGLRIAVLSDLHVGSPWNGIDNLHRVVETTNAAGADLVLLLGDYVVHGVVGGEFVEIEAIAGVLSELKAPVGVRAVLGNHDHWYDGPRVRAALEAAGIPVLDDASTLVSNSECSFHLLGLRDLWTDQPDVEAAWATLGEIDEPLIVFTHNPDLFPEIPDRADLTIAGHTHGGQVNLPFIGRPIVPSAFGERFAIGHVQEGEHHLFVSSGVGTSIFPIRFLVPPEVTILEIRSSRSDPSPG